MSNAFSLPVGELFTTNNYTDAFSKLNILNAYKNSIVISGTVAAWCFLQLLGKISVKISRRRINQFCFFIHFFLPDNISYARLFNHL